MTITTRVHPSDPRATSPVRQLYLKQRRGSYGTTRAAHVERIGGAGFGQKPLCIVYPALNTAVELTSGLIHLLPTFHELIGEDPNKHLKEFHVVCSSMKPTGISEEQVK